MAVSNTGTTLATDMEGYAMPKTPSNRATTNVMPGCFTASPNCWPGTGRPAICKQRGEKGRKTSIQTMNLKKKKKRHIL